MLFKLLKMNLFLSLGWVILVDETGNDISFVSFVHGLFPWVWETKAKELINGDPQDFKAK